MSYNGKDYLLKDYRMADLNELYNELNNQNAKLEEQLLRYRNYGFIPKLHVKDWGYTLNIKDNKVEQFQVDEIVLDMFGLTYREYISESEFRVVPDDLCFTNEQEATKALEKYNTSIA